MKKYKVIFKDESGKEFSMPIEAKTIQEARTKFKIDYPSLTIIRIS